MQLNKINININNSVELIYEGTRIKEYEIELKQRKGGFIVSCPDLKCFGYSENSFEEAKKDLKEDIIVNLVYGSYIINKL